MIPMIKLSGLALKKKLLVGGVIVALAAGGVTAALNQPQSTGADTSPLTQEVDRQGQELSNHEARITNNESDIKNLQNNTGTAPSANRESVPYVSSTTQTLVSAPNTPTVSPASAPAVVTKSNLLIGGQYDGYCQLTYSDGSQSYSKATLTTTGNGNSGNTEDNCASFIGQQK